MPEFRVTRASDFHTNGDDKLERLHSPCADAYPKEERRERFGGEKYSWFENYIMLDWEDLPAFIKKEGTIILDKNPDLSICIYDAYVE